MSYHTHPSSQRPSCEDERDSLLVPPQLVLRLYPTKLADLKTLAQCVRERRGGRGAEGGKERRMNILVPVCLASYASLHSQQLLWNG